MSSPSLEPTPSFTKALADQAQTALKALESWEDEDSVLDATWNAIGEVQKVVKESGEHAKGWSRDEEMREDVLAFLRTAREHVGALRSSKRHVFHRFSLYPKATIGSEIYIPGGRILHKIGRDTPLSLLLQSALIVHMAVFARANGSITGTIFQNPEKGELLPAQKLSRDRYIEGMLLGIIENLNLLGWDTGMQRKAAIGTIVRHLPEVTGALISGEMIHNVLKKAGGKYAEQSDEWIDATFSYSAKVTMLINNPNSLEETIISRATTALFLDDNAWLNEQFKGLTPPALDLARDCIRIRRETFAKRLSEMTLKDRLRKLREDANLFVNETELKKTLADQHQVTFSGSLSDVPKSFLALLLDNENSVKYFARFLKGETGAKGAGLDSDVIRARLQPRAI